MYELGVFWNQEKILDYFNSVFKVMLELSVSSDCFVINAEADDEPYLISPVLTVDYDGKVYCGCALPLEKRLPTLKAVNFIDGVDKIDTITQVQRSRQESAHRVINSYLSKSAPRRLILNNLIMGEISETFFREFWIRQVPREK